MGLSGTKHYKLQEFAKLLGVSTTTLQRWDREGILKAYRTPTNRRYYTDDQYQIFQKGKSEMPPEHCKKMLKSAIETILVDEGWDQGIYTLFEIGLTHDELVNVFEFEHSEIIDIWQKFQKDAAMDGSQAKQNDMSGGSPK